MNTIKAWLANKNVSAHTIAVVVAGAVGAYYQVPAFHALALQTWGAIPQTLREVATAATGVVMIYWNPLSNGQQKSAGNGNRVGSGEGISK